jgi:hypothetical protein
MRISGRDGAPIRQHWGKRPGRLKPEDGRRQGKKRGGEIKVSFHVLALRRQPQDDVAVALTRPA